MTWTHVFEQAPGGACSLAAIIGAEAPSVPGGLRWRAIAPSEALPPLALSEAWRLAEDGTLSVDAGAARVVHAAALRATARSLSRALALMAEDEDLSGNDARAAVLRGHRSAVLAPSDLSGFSDPAALAAFEPPAFAAARAALAAAD